MNDYMKKFQESADFIKEKIPEIPKIAIVLGSGLGSLANDVTDNTIINYKDIPNFPISTVPGHKGELIYGHIGNTPVLLMNGRFHYYEGYDMKTVTFPTRVFSLLGIDTILLTNAAGGINANFNKGDLMIINDQLSFFAESVLRGPNMDEFGARFIDMTTAYDKEYIELLKKIMTDVMGYYREGVYAYMKGPTYETPAEIRALRMLGADAVGMSTVPEAIVAHHCGMKVAGITCITNMAAGMENVQLSHEEVKETALKAEDNFKEVVKQFVKKL